MKATVFKTGSYISDEHVPVSTQSICMEIEGRGKVHFVRLSWPAPLTTEHRLDRFERCNGDCRRSEIELSTEEFDKVVSESRTVALNAEEIAKHEADSRQLSFVFKGFHKDEPPRPLTIVRI